MSSLFQESMEAVFPFHRQLCRLCDGHFYLSCWQRLAPRAAMQAKLQWSASVLGDLMSWEHCYRQLHLGLCWFILRAHGWEP